MAADLGLGAIGAAMGIRFLTAEEAGFPLGWQKKLLRAVDGDRCDVNQSCSSMSSADWSGTKEDASLCPLIVID